MSSDYVSSSLNSEDDCYRGNTVILSPWFSILLTGCETMATPHSFQNHPTRQWQSGKPTLGWLVRETRTYQQTESVLLPNLKSPPLRSSEHSGLMHDRLQNFLIPVHSDKIMIFFHRDENGITSSPAANLFDHRLPSEVYKNPFTLLKRLVLTFRESPLSFGRAKNFERPVEENFSHN